MKVTQHLERAQEPLISFEIIPPLRGGNLQSLLNLIDDLMEFHPPFIDITSHPAEVIYEETPQGIMRKVKRKRPGTLGVCALIQNKYQVDAVPHVLCQAFTREETEDFLIELRYLGIDNVLDVRGDESTYKKSLQHGRSRNPYAVDLVNQIMDMNKGQYLEEDLLDSDPTSFCVGVAGYPEKHFESPNQALDLKFTQAKVAAGGEYIVTQMFFDNKHYFNFVEKAREAGIQVPILPGIKILANRKQLTSIPRTFHCEIPSDLTDEVMAASVDNVLNVGIEWAANQVQDLLDRGVPSVHFYVMSSAAAVRQTLGKIKR